MKRTPMLIVFALLIVTLSISTPNVAAQASQQAGSHQSGFQADRGFQALGRRLDSLSRKTLECSLSR